ncbi:hypothetical protein ABEF92_003020 [Exophiala dermatitidis]|uniref:non-specific serine/threonine protein kinase n=1 Tax=Exophiala dermatitidis (strain ATCC 34100 / CBS 525.76 / NIH/UT8656) TaxID=858893 RepID=H6CBB9_EXODN|nr:serine/threonine-protein kinase Chk2 [Exophiala dermatitidis NIH/UT8656]EHY61066.1 serine/threonine-protein kinase Chk2 [Exophiala dermatitidis NIH/UT8656]
MPAYVAGPQNTVVVLTSKTHAAYNALLLEHNKKFVPHPTIILGVEDNVEDRQCTPEPGPLRETCLTITLDDPPYDPLEGWVCGSDPECCFVLLNERRSGGGISRKHFSLDYNWENGSLLLKDMSTHGTVRSSYPTVDHKRELSRGWYTCRDAREQALPRIGNLILRPPETRTVLNSSKLGLSDPVGSGSFSEVRRAIDCRGDIFAVKIFRSIEDPKYFHSEQQILCKLRHENIVCVFENKVVDVLTSKEIPYLVMEYCQEGSLFSKGLLSPSETTVVLGQVCNGVQYIHSRGLVHRDLKPENILLTSWAPAWVKISDFGLAQSEKTLRTFCGTPMFVAPEICYDVDCAQSNLDDTSSTISTVILRTSDASPSSRSTQGLSAKYSNKVDVWSILIMLLFYAREGDIPGDCQLLNMKQFHDKILEYSKKAVKPAWTRHINLARQCIALNPFGRPSAQQLQKHFAELRESGTTTPMSARHL